MSNSSLLEILILEEFGVAYGQRIVLADVNLRVPRRGIVNLLGPAGTGKSTLIRTLARLNDAQPALRTWGTVTLAGEVWKCGDKKENALTACEGGITMVTQDARFFITTVRENLASALLNRSSLTRLEQNDALEEAMVESDLQEIIPHLDEGGVQLSLGQQRRLAVLRASLGNPAVLCVDEASVGLKEEESTQLLDLLAKEADKRAVVCVTHNQSYAKRLGGKCVLLAGGRVQEEAEASLFFVSQKTTAGQSFVASGRCSLPSPDAIPEELSDDTPLPPPLPKAAIAAVASRYVGPTGFFWVKPGQLGGVPRPGLFAELEDDLAGLQRLGITLLVTLEEVETVKREVCEKAGIANHHLAIVDMEAPTFEEASTLCSYIDTKISDGHVVAVHCRAGLGRTGTILAAQLVWDQRGPIEAIDYVRSINAKFIQSEMQVEFLIQFSKWLNQGFGPSSVANHKQTTPHQTKQR